ncbi:MAG: sugar nucleotide-binding protein [Cypionkella sp.]|nr:sugar nucleotide-binding protein [Cypionkella sp.]
MAEIAIAVTGAGGRIGRLLAQEWKGKSVTFLTRKDWDILSSQPPPIRPRVVLDLAGVVRGDFGTNPLLAARVASWARDHGARLLYLSSAAVYPGGPEPMQEDTNPAPVSDYGKSKLMAETALHAALPDATCLRLSNLAGADALLGGLSHNKQVLLDPVSGETGGPIRSYIGPSTLARVLGHLVLLAQQGAPLPVCLNISQPGTVSMADLLTAAGADWRFGPRREGVLARMELSTERLASIVDLPQASAEGLWQEVCSMEGWP